MYVKMYSYVNRMSILLDIAFMEYIYNLKDIPFVFRIFHSQSLYIIYHINCIIDLKTSHINLQHERL